MTKIQRKLEGRNLSSPVSEEDLQHRTEGRYHKVFAGLGLRHTPWHQHGAHTTGTLHHLPVVFVSEIPSLPPCRRARARARHNSHVECQHRARRAARMRIPSERNPEVQSLPSAQNRQERWGGCDGQARVPPACAPLTHLSTGCKQRGGGAAAIYVCVTHSIALGEPQGDCEPFPTTPRQTGCSTSLPSLSAPHAPHRSQLPLQKAEQ